MNTLRRRLFAVAALGLSAVAAVAAEAPPDAATASARGDEADSPAESHCLRATGSRIAPEPGKCLPQAGRVITHEEMRRTGATTAAEAVRDGLP